MAITSVANYSNLANSVTLASTAMLYDINIKESDLKAIQSCEAKTLKPYLS